MTKFLKTPLLMLTGFFTLGVLLLSCEKKEDFKTDTIELLSFGPTGAQPGDTLRFIGNNLDQVSAIDLTGATVAQNAFLQQTAELILIIVPAETEQGFITLKTSKGDIVSKTKLNLDVPVTVTTMPTVARPGENITLNGTYLNWVTRVTFGKDKIVDSFVSKSLNQLVVTVPKDAQSGSLIISYGGTEPNEFETDSTLSVTLPTVTAMAPNPAEREKELTISGTDLDLVKGVIFTGKTIADTVFVSQSKTTLVVKVPKEANKGTIKLVAHSGVMTESTESLLLMGDLPPLTDFPLPIYTDALQNGFQDWSWATRDFESKANVRQGNKSILVTYGSGGYEGLTFHNDAGVATAAYPSLEFSVFGEAGTDGKTVNMIINGDWGKTYSFVVTEGEWKTISFKLADIGVPNPLKEVILQSAGWSGQMHVDHVGLR